MDNFFKRNWCERSEVEEHREIIIFVWMFSVWVNDLIWYFVVYIKVMQWFKTSVIKPLEINKQP